MDFTDDRFERASSLRRAMWSHLVSLPAMDFADSRFESASGLNFTDILRYSQTHPPQDYDDIMEEFRRNGREVENTPENKERPKYSFRYISKSYKTEKELWCALCKNNGSVNYKSHQLKDKNGKVVCPVLQLHVCPICGATGPDSHTENYCPWNTNRSAVALMNVLKCGRRATGEFKSRRNFN